METLLKIFKKLNNHSEPEKAKTINTVAVFGFADAKPHEIVYKDAFRVCAALAQAGYTIVNGGGPGVMEASTRGAHSGGGKVVGVTFYPKDTAHFEGRDINNPIDKEIKTDDYLERTLTLLKEGQVYIVFNGATGTLSEFAMAWGLARLYFGYHKPLILYGNFWKKVVEVLQKKMMIREEETKVYKIVDCPDEVLRAIKKFEEEIHEGRHEHLVISEEEEPFILQKKEE